MSGQDYDMIVLGGGPGGYVAAIRAAQLGLKVACVDENAQLGGVCLRVGCIPSKALLESSWRLVEAAERLSEHGVKAKEVQADLGAMMKRKQKIVKQLAKGVESLLGKHKIDIYRGRGRLKGDDGLVVRNGDEEETSLEAEHVILATGSHAASLPGVEFDPPVVGTSEDALGYEEAPKRLVVVGAGYIGLEMGSVWSRLGAEVTVLEYLDRVLPGTDAETAKLARKQFEKQGLSIETGCEVTGVERKKKDGPCIVKRKNGDPVEADRVLIAVGRTPNVEDLGLDEAGVELSDSGAIAVDEHFATSAEGIYAIGDCIGEPMLAHKASEEGVACVEGIVNGYGEVDYDAIPAVIFTHPEIAAVGKTEETLQEEGIAYEKGVFAMRANGRALTLGDTAGQVKVLSDKSTDRVLGVHIIGARAGDMIAEAAAAMAFGASSEDMARICHTHPTLSEAIGEAARAVQGQAIHA